MLITYELVPLPFKRGDSVHLKGEDELFIQRSTWRSKPQKKQTKAKPAL